MRLAPAFLLLAAGCAGPRVALRREPLSAAPVSDVRLDADAMARYVAAERLLAMPGPGAQVDDRAGQAAALLREALTLEPDAAPVWRTLGYALLLDADLPAARQAATRALELDPKDARNFYMLGEIEQKLGQLTDAERHLREAARYGIGGDDPHLPHYYLYWVLREQGRVDDALTALDGWSRALPEDPNPATLRAQILWDDGRVDPARAAAIASLHQTPSSEAALRVLLDTHRLDLSSEQRWDPRDAIDLPALASALEGVLRLDWSTPTLHRALAEVWERIGRYDRALDHVRTLDLLAPEPGGSVLRRAELLSSMHRGREARELLAERLAETAGVERDRARIAMARTWEREGRLADATRELEHVTDSKLVSWALAERMRLLIRAGDAKSAAALGTAALRSAPQDAERGRWLDPLVDARARLGDLDGAKEALDELGGLDAAASLRARIGLALSWNEPGRAVDVATAACEARPDDVGAQVLRLESLGANGDGDGVLRALAEARAAVDASLRERTVAATPTRRLEAQAQRDRQDLALVLAASVALHECGRLGDVRALLDPIAVARPWDAGILNFFGYTLAELGADLEVAEEVVQRAFDQRAFDGAVADSLGWVRFQQGRYGEAVELLRQATIWQPGDPEILHHLGEALMAAGDAAGAQAAWQRALRDGDPRDRRHAAVMRQATARLEVSQATSRRR